MKSLWWVAQEEVWWWHRRKYGGVEKQPYYQQSPKGLGIDLTFGILELTSFGLSLDNSMNELRKNNVWKKHAKLNFVYSKVWCVVKLILTE